MRDIDVPICGDGFLDLARAEPTLEDAAMLWIWRLRRALRERQALPKPTVTAARV